MKTLSIFLSLLLLISLSSQSDYDPKIAFEMLRASSATYCSSGLLEGNNCGAVCRDLTSSGYQYILQFVHSLTSSESVSYSLFVNPNKKRYVVAFRGSSDYAQMLSVFLNADPVAYSLHSIDKAVATRYFYEHYRDDLRPSLFSNLEKAIAQYPDYQFFFTGHSLGGAFTTLAALDVVLSRLLPKTQVHMYNYGSPRVGNVKFAQAVEDNVKGGLFRQVHWKDFAPHLPPCITNINGVCHNGEGITLNENDVYLYYAWHVGPQVFYNEDSSSYKICTTGEDRTCSEQFPLKDVKLADHSVYMGVPTACGEQRMGLIWTFLFFPFLCYFYMNF